MFHRDHAVSSLRQMFHRGNLWPLRTVMHAPRTRVRPTVTLPSIYTGSSMSHCGANDAQARNHLKPCIIFCASSVARLVFTGARRSALPCRRRQRAHINPLLRSITFLRSHSRIVVLPGEYLQHRYFTSGRYLTEWNGTMNKGRMRELRTIDAPSRCSGPAGCNSPGLREHREIVPEMGSGPILRWRGGRRALQAHADPVATARTEFKGLKQSKGRDS